MIPLHLRRNFEATDDLFNDLKCLLVALEAVEDLIPANTASRESNAACTLRQMAQAKIVEIEKSRAVEWAGIGGETAQLTAAERAEARGQ